MVKKKLLSFVPSRASLSLSVVCYIGAYLMFQYSGFFGPKPAGMMRLFHAWPLLAGLGILMAGSIAGLYRLIRNGRNAEGKEAGPLMILHAGVVVVWLGFFLSSLTRFEGSLTITEGQERALVITELDPDSLYVRNFSRLPSGKLSLAGVAPVLSSDHKKIKRTAARLFLMNNKNPEQRELGINSLLPRLADGYFYRIRDIGYSLRYTLFDSGADIADEAYVVLKLLPLGAEDSFRMMQMPHTFYLRYYPEAAMVTEKDKIPKGATGPLVMVRIARNLELVAYTYVQPDEVVSFDSIFISFGDARIWAEIEVVSDAGYFLMLPGGIILLLSGSVIAVRKFRYKGLGQNRAELS